MIRTRTLLASACVCLLSWQASAQSVCTGWPDPEPLKLEVTDAYCDDLRDAATLERKYARIAPIHSSRETGWIIANDQLRDDYGAKKVAIDLLSEIVGEFGKRGITLAIMVAPPRPIVAGEAVVEATLAGEGDYDVDAASASFRGLIDDVRETGAIAPDLLGVATADEAVREGYYFRRDTHWTPFGAAVSSFALAEAVYAARPDLLDAAPAAFDAVAADPAGVEERGSLADVVREVCGVDPAREVVPTFDFGTDTGLGLLDEPAQSGRLALVGTSFSNRYGRDTYRVADALAAATGKEVDNYSVSGGGLIGAIESYVTSGEIDTGRHDLVVWEMPYTFSFKVSSLRQLLGALEARSAGGTLMSQALAEDGRSHICLAPAGDRDILLAIDTGNERAQRVRGIIRFDNGTESKFTVSRGDRVPADRRSAEIYLSLAAFPGRLPVEIALDHEPGIANLPTVSVLQLD